LLQNIEFEETCSFFVNDLAEQAHQKTSTKKAQENEDPAVFAIGGRHRNNNNRK